MRAIVLSLVLSISFLAMAMTAIRRGRLREHAAVLWLAVSLVMVLLSATLPTHLLDHAARLAGIAYPPDLILLLAVLFLVILVFHLSLAVSRLSANQTILVQEIALMTTFYPTASSHGNFAAGESAPSAPNEADPFS
jgi:hypothetical protein